MTIFLVILRLLEFFFGIFFFPTEWVSNPDNLSLQLLYSSCVCMQVFVCSRDSEGGGGSGA